MVEEKKVKDLSAEEFSQLLNLSGKGNFIEVNGVSVHSTTEDLEEVEKTINRLLDRHRELILLKKEQVMTTGYTG